MSGVPSFHSSYLQKTEKSSTGIFGFVQSSQGRHKTIVAKELLD